jgi:hypothetical protein
MSTSCEEVSHSCLNEIDGLLCSDRIEKLVHVSAAVSTTSVCRQQKDVRRTDQGHVPPPGKQRSLFSCASACRATLVWDIGLWSHQYPGTCLDMAVELEKDSANVVA